MKKIITIIFTIIALALITACPTDTEDPVSTNFLSVGTSSSNTSSNYVGLVNFKETVEAATGGDVVVSLFPDSNLGSESELLTDMANGRGVAVLVGSDTLKNYVDEFKIMWAPYAFETRTDFMSFCTTDTYKTWAAKFNGTGYSLLAFNWFQGARHIVTDSGVVQISSPTNLSDVTLRSISLDIAQDSLEAMGATTTILPWGSISSSLQNGSIDGFEAQITALSGFTNDIDRVALTGHFIGSSGLLISEAWLATLPANYQDIILNAANAAGVVATAQVVTEIEDAKTDLSAVGIIFNDVTNVQEFINDTVSVYDIPANSDYKTYKAQIDAALP